MVQEKAFFKSEAGEEKVYTNLNAAIAAYIVELATGVPFKDYTRQEIFAPLKMPSTTWDQKEIPSNQMATRYFPRGGIVANYDLITYPDGGLFSNVDDMSYFLMEIMKGYFDTSTMLSDPSINCLLPGDGDQERAFWG